MRSHGLVHVSYFAKSWCSCINNELNLCSALSISFFIWSENNFISIVPVWPIEMGQRKMGCERVDPLMLFSEELPSKFLASKWGFECLTVLINSEKKIEESGIAWQLPYTLKCQCQLTDATDQLLSTCFHKSISRMAGRFYNFFHGFRLELNSTFSKNCTFNISYFLGHYYLCQ